LEDSEQKFTKENAEEIAYVKTKQYFEHIVQNLDTLRPDSISYACERLTWLYIALKGDMKLSIAREGFKEGMKKAVKYIAKTYPMAAVTQEKKEVKLSFEERMPNLFDQVKDEHGNYQVSAHWSIKMMEQLIPEIAEGYKSDMRALFPDGIDVSVKDLSADHNALRRIN